MQRERSVITETVERVAFRVLTSEMAGITLVEKRSGLLSRPWSGDVSDTVFVYFDLMGNVTVQHDCLPRQSFFRAKRDIVPGENAVHTCHVHDRLDYRIAKCLETRAHHLHYGPPVVPIDD